MEERINEMESIINKIHNSKRIVITDDENFEAGMCLNGGHYRLKTTLIRTSKGWEKRFSSSYEDACQYCGDAYCHGDCVPVIASISEVLHLVRAALSDSTECRYYPGEKAISVLFE